VLSDGEIIEAIGKDIWISLPDSYEYQHPDHPRYAETSFSDIQPASVDVRLAHRFRVFDNFGDACIDPMDKTQQLTREIVVPEGETFLLHPGDFVLGSTVEVVRLGPRIVGRIEGKSSLGRLGLLIHSTAGFVDPGFEGQLTLELANVSRLPIRLYPGMYIGQISFDRMERPALKPYGHPDRNSKYQRQGAAAASRFADNY